MKTKAKKKPAPQDSTLRNIRAANKRLGALETRVHDLAGIVTILQADVDDLNRALADVPDEP